MKLCISNLKGGREGRRKGRRKQQRGQLGIILSGEILSRRDWKDRKKLHLAIVNDSLDS